MPQIDSTWRPGMAENYASHQQLALLDALLHKLATRDARAGAGVRSALPAIPPAQRGVPLRAAIPPPAPLLRTAMPTPPMPAGSQRRAIAPQGEVLAALAAILAQGGRVQRPRLPTPQRYATAY